MNKIAQAMHGPQYSRLVLSVLYGDRWADADGAENALGEFNPNQCYVS